MDVMRSDPNGMRPGGNYPRAGRPDVSTAIPSVIPASPDIAGTRRDGAALNDWSRGANTNYYFRICSAKSQEQAQGRGNE